MQLLINTNGENNLVALYGDDGKFLSKQLLVSSSNQTDELLESVEKLLAENRAGKKDITKILVNSDAISYTGARVGVATANALALSLDVPVESIAVGADVPDHIKLTRAGDNFASFVSLVYKHGPKITKPRTRN